MALSDDEYVAQVVASIAHWRARNAAFLEAAARIDPDPVHQAVSARFDSNGTLLELQIAPTALSDYTNVELEAIITDVLRQTRASVHTQMMELFEKYLAPGSPGFKPDILGVPYVTPPE
ncbi:type I secretion protein TolC (plasmid) [Mycolicibacterium psychrotolerans]|uniref:type I secretion protein TolC n=1 Tax=Mycolicibacterium psychrotolerans TaxID=216929 RepID=UPI003D678C6F